MRYRFREVSRAGSRNCRRVASDEPANTKGIRENREDIEVITERLHSINSEKTADSGAGCVMYGGA